MLEGSSRALPASYYRDPAEIVEHNQMRSLGCLACNKHTHLLGKVVCTEVRKLDNKNVPRIGDKCKYFELKG